VKIQDSPYNEPFSLIRGGIFFGKMFNMGFVPWRKLMLWGHAVAQLVEALRYKPEGHGFDS